VPGVRAALDAAPAPVVAVSPLVRGEVLKGPTESFMAWAGHSLDSDGVAAAYDGVVDGLVADERTDRVPVLETDVLMEGSAGRRPGRMMPSSSKTPRRPARGPPPRSASRGPWK